MLRSFRTPCFGSAITAAAMALLSACSGPQKASDGPSEDPGQNQETEAVATLDSLRGLADPAVGDLNAALNALDAARSHYQDRAEFWQLYGDTNLAFAAAEIRRGRTDALDLMYGDADFAYGRWLELDPGNLEALHGRIRARRLLGDFEGAWQAAEECLALLGPDPDPALREEIGRAGLALVIEAVQANQPIPAAAGPAEHQLQLARDQGVATAVVPLADLQAWTGRNEAARLTLTQALTQTPTDAAIADRLTNLCTPEQRVAAWEMVRANRGEDAMVHWKLGEALWHLHWARRQAGDFLGAHHALDRAEENFLTSMAIEPSYQVSCQDWLHLVRTARGWVYWADGAVDDAADAFLAALESDPSHLEEEPIAESLSLGIYSVVGNAFDQNRLDKACAILGRLWQTYRDNPDWTNNYGFACRDLGVLRLQQGEADEASQLFDQAWEAYSRTVELAPEDVRLINDRALIAVYYLDREWELAEQELHRAIQLGTRQLAEMGADVPPKERQDLDEAVGDAWENLAYLDVMRRGRIDRAEEFLDQAVLHYPTTNRRGVAAIHARIEEIRAENSDS